MPGHGLGVDFASGLGLVLPAMPLDAPALTRGGSADAAIGDDLLMLAQGGIGHSLATRLDERKAFAGYWEYVLDEALYTSPADPSWSGGAVVDMRGRLIGIGSLLVQQAGQDDDAKHANMSVPVDLLEPILHDHWRPDPSTRLRLCRKAWDRSAPRITAWSTTHALRRWRCICADMENSHLRQGAEPSVNQRLPT